MSGVITREYSIAKFGYLNNKKNVLRPWAVFLWDKNKSLERELVQQRFNNKNNLSIDQKVSDKIQMLKSENATIKEWSDKHINELKDKIKAKNNGLRDLCYCDEINNLQTCKACKYRNGE